MPRNLGKAHIQFDADLGWLSVAPDGVTKSHRTRRQAVRHLEKWAERRTEPGELTSMVLVTKMRRIVTEGS